MTRRALPALLFALVLAGCTQAPTSDTGDFSGEEGEVAALVGDLSEAATRREAAAVCDDVLSERLREEVAGDSSCIDEVEKAFEDADQAVIDVEEVTVDGTEATAEVSSEQQGEDVRRTFRFVQEDDEWRIDSFGAAPASG